MFHCLQIPLSQRGSPTMSWKSWRSTWPCTQVIQHGLNERNGGDAIGSILKVRGTEMAQKLTDMLVEVIGDYGTNFYPDFNEDPKLRGANHIGPDYAPGLMAELIYRRASSIYGGTNEIQRNLIAKTRFGL